MSRFQAIILIILMFCGLGAGIFTFNHNNHFRDNKSSFLNCGEGFFYNTKTATYQDAVKLEELALQCPQRKIDKRGTHDVVLDEGVLITPTGTSITHTDDYYVDNILVINWEVSKENHLAIAERYLQ